MLRRDEVLDTALHLFAEHGYAATTTARIEAELGLRAGGGGLFRHVKGKQDLLEAAIERAMSRSHTPPPGPFRSPAHQLVRVVLAFVDDDLDLWKLVVREPHLPIDLDALYATLVQPAFDQAADWLQALSGDRSDARARVTVAISALLYLRISEFTYDRTPGGVDADDFVAVVEQLLTGGPS